MMENLVSLLQKAQTDDQREELIIKSSLKAFGKELGDVVYAAAIPHWFDTSLLAFILDSDIDSTDRWIKRISFLPYIEKYPNRGLSIHDQTRKVLLSILWNENRDRYLEFSQRAYIYCHDKVNDAPDEFVWRMEEIYHLLVAQPEEGTICLNNVCEKWSYKPFFWFDRVDALLEVVSEHYETERVNKKESNWFRYWRGFIKYVYGKYVEAKEYLITLNLDDPDVDKNLLLKSLELLGDIERKLNKANDLDIALAHYNRVKEIYEELSGSDNENVARILYKIGKVLIEQAKYHEANSMIQKALQINENVLGLKHIYIARNYDALGLVCHHLRYNQEALEYFEMAVKIAEETLSPNHFELAKYLNQLAMAQHILGNENDAKLSAERALSISIRAFGENHPDVARIKNTLASILFRGFNDYRTSRELFEQTIEINKKFYGPNYKDIAFAYDFLSSIAQELGNLDEAEHLMERSLKILVKIDKPNHPRIATARNNLGEVYRDNGKYKEAENNFREALRVWRVSLPEDHPHIAIAAINLGDVQALLKNFSGAYENYAIAYNIYKNREGKQSLKTIEVKKKLITIRRKIRRQYHLYRFPFKKGSQRE